MRSHRLTRSVGFLLLTVILTGCLSGAPAFPAHGTQEDALGKVLSQQVTIAYQEPFGENRAMVLFRTDNHPGLSSTLLERTALGKWRMTDAVGLGDALPRVGGLSYGRGNLGHWEEKSGSATTVRAEGHVVFGEVLDPAITWVEVRLYEEGAQPMRAKVEGGIWILRLPPEAQNTWFDLRAGNADGLRSAVSFGGGFAGRRSMDPSTAPLVEYLDTQQGILLQHPAFATPRTDRDGRLIVTFDAWTVTVERKARDQSAGLDELLQATLAATDVPVLEHGIRQLGTRQAGYLLESRPEQAGQGSTYIARYLGLTERFGYEVSCSAPHIHSISAWKEYLEPVCERVLATVRLGDV